MLSFLNKVEIYEIIVDPCKSMTWMGKFNFKPKTEDVVAAIQEDINALDSEVEHEHDMIRDLICTLELVTISPQLLGRVSIAGAYLGEISIAIIKVFGKDEPSMMPALPRLPGEILLGGNR